MCTEAKAKAKAISEALAKNDYFCGRLNSSVSFMRPFFLIALLFPLLLKAQQDRFYFVQKPDSNLLTANRVERYLALLDEKTLIEGSMYLDDEFAPANLVMTNRQVLTQVFLRYNVFRDQMEMIRENDTLLITKPGEVGLITIGREQFRWLPFEGRDTVAHGYFEVVSEGFYRLLVRRVMLFEPANPPYTALQIGNEYDRFVPLEFLYLQVGDEPAVRLKRSSAFLQKTFGSQWPAIKEFIKTANLSLRKRPDAERVVRYCNSLLESDKPSHTAPR